MLTQIESSSPFDSIRHFDGDTEYWLARELMTVMGYTLWQNFETAINEAIENIKLTGDSVLDHFLLAAIKKDGNETRGRKGKDYKLTRYACYMVALCCDARKIEVASAKKYFVVKTRQAETVIPQQDLELEKLKLINENLRLRKDVNELDHTMLCLHGVSVVLALRGQSDQIVREEVVVTEVVEPKTNTSTRILTADQIKREIKKRTGQTIPSLKYFIDEIRKANRDDLIVPVTRHTTSEYVTPENLDEAIDIVFRDRRQGLIGS